MSNPAPQTPLREPASERGLETRERLLDAAERLFARHGFDGTSTRALTRAAGASLSAVNYHFGSKEALLRATLLRRLEPVNRSRLERLAALEARCGEGPLVLEDVLQAFLAPAFEALTASEEAPDQYRQVAARLFSDPPELVSSLKQELFGELVERFVGALGRALPEAEPAEIALAFQLTVGVMVHVMGGHLEGPALPRDAAPPLPHVLDRMVAYAAAGVRAAAGASTGTLAPAGGRR